MLIRYLMAFLLSLVLSPAWGAAPPTAPAVASSAASGLSTTGATLNGIVSSNGASTVVSFDYGPTIDYGSTVTAGSLVASATNTAVSAAVMGLTCGTSYHYRVNGTNSAGTTIGSDATFITSACVPTLGITAGTSAAPINSFVWFNLQATNANSTDLSNVVLTDVLPVGMTYKSNATAVGTVSVVGQTLTWIIPSLPAGESASLTLSARVTLKGTLTNTVTSPGGATSASVSILVLPSAITHYHMDEPVGTWTGAATDVWDSGGNKLNGHRRTTASATTTNAVSPSPAISSQYSSVVGDFCNAGYFDGNAVVESASSPYFQFQQTLSASAWIYPTALPSGNNIYSILSNDTNYEFHLNSSGQLYWWWQDASTHAEFTLTSKQAIPLNHWTHIAITFDSSLGSKSRQIIYINGVPDSNTSHWSGTLAPNACPFYIGGDIATSNPPGKSCDLIQQRNFHGKIDEAKIYDYELSAAEVNADMTLGRLCNGAFDHIEIDHDGSASVCTPKTVTLKACLDVNCTALYTDQVSVKLSPSGWLPGDTVTFDGGLGTATLNNSSLIPPSITLGTVSMTPNANNKTRCFNVANGRQETCTLNVPVPPPNLNCFFDAVETNILPNPPNPPRTNLYTKLVGTDFKVDLLALLKSDKTKVDTNYTGTVTTYDLVDASTCPSGTPLNTTSYPSFTYKSTDEGRKTVTMNCPTPSSSVRVRIQIGSTYACSYDEFTVRPLSVTLTSTDAKASSPTPLATDMPIIKAGALFNIGATTTPAGGYKGALMLESKNLTAQSDGTGTTLGTLWLSPFTLGTTTYGSATNNPAVQANMPPVKNATYSEVGYLYAKAGAFVDKTYTTVDQTHGNCAATNTCDCWLPDPNDPSVLLNSLSNTLINGRYGCYFGNTVNSPDKTSFAFGRFIPDHFDTEAIPTKGCESFYYSGQPITVQVTAMNGLPFPPGPGKTSYYDNTAGFAKRVTLSDANDPTAGVGTLSSNSISANFFVSGATPPQPVPPATTPQPFTSTYSYKSRPSVPHTINLRAVDAEGVSSATFKEGPASIVSGRLRLIAGQGSELAPFWMQTEVQRYNAGGFWETSIDDSCTSYDAKNFAVSDSVPPTGTKVSLGVGDVKQIYKGFGSFMLTKPTGRGTAKICLDVGTKAGDGCIAPTPIGIPDLGYLRPTPGLDPSATVTFGGANSNSRGNWGYLYRRENF